MINHLLMTIPKSCYLAFSGGRDSVAAMDFLLQGRRDVILLHFNHGTEHGEEAEAFCRKTAANLGLKIHVGQIKTEKPKSESQEEFWRNERYQFLDCFSDKPVITAHHLDDCVETYLFSALTSSPRTIPRRRGNVIRPFLAFNQSHLHSFIKNASIDDPGNQDEKYMRNFIRRNICPLAYRVNPGLKKIVLENFSRESPTFND